MNESHIKIENCEPTDVIQGLNRAFAQFEKRRIFLPHFQINI